jgi:phenylpropionate dioxygenase-like ring-hydroxylating dioxygenase large terminal subunit
MLSRKLDQPLRDGFVSKLDYISRDVVRLEAERLWGSVWLMAGREQQVMNPGDYVVFNIADESILVLRDKAGELRAFYNVCQHRGRRLKDDEAGNTKTQIQCPFHAWRYDLDGTVSYICSRDDWDGCPGFDEANLSLKPVRVDTWGGWVWISMDPDIEPLLDYLAPVPELYRNFEFEKCRIGWYVTIVAPCNWKMAIDAFNEAYHVEGTHPQMIKFSGKGKVPTLAAGRHGSLRVSRSESATLAKGATPAAPAAPPNVAAGLLGIGRELRSTLKALYTDYFGGAAERLARELPTDTPPAEAMARFKQFHREEMEAAGAEWPANLTEEDIVKAGGTWHVFPNSIILSSYDGAMCYRARPNGDDPDSCLFDVWWLGRYAPGKEPPIVHEHFDGPAAFKGRNPFLEQDFGNMGQTQKGMRSRGFTGALPNPVQEVTVSHFHRVLHAYLDGTPLPNTGP